MECLEVDVVEIDRPFAGAAAKRNLRTAGDAPAAVHHGDEIVERHLALAPRESRRDRAQRQMVCVDRARDRVFRLEMTCNPAVGRTSLGVDDEARRRQRGVPRVEIEIVRVKGELVERDRRERSEPRVQRETRVAGTTCGIEADRFERSGERDVGSRRFLLHVAGERERPFQGERRSGVDRGASGELAARQHQREPLHAMRRGAARVPERDAGDAAAVRSDRPLEIGNGDFVDRDRRRQRQRRRRRNRAVGRL